MKELHELKIDPELRDLLPALTKEEGKKLEENLKENGCQLPLFVWQGYIADGHNRYTICKAHNIPFEIVTLAYKEKSEVMRWMIDGQLGRRNLTPIQRVAVAEKYREKFEKIAKDRQGTRTDLNLVTNLSQGNDSETESNRTRTELAKLADVSEGTYDKAKKILNSDNEEVKQKVLSGEIKIDKGYKEIFKPKIEEEKIFHQLPQTERFAPNVELKNQILIFMEMI